jgi:glutamyl-tRNA synthetase
VNAQKKAAKAAAKASAKAAYKAGGAPPAAAAKPAEAVAKAAALPKAAAVTPAATAPTTTNYASVALLRKLAPGQIVWNPNAALPLVALTTAVLSNTILDYNLTPDYKATGVALGLPNGACVQGDLALARTVARHCVTSTLYPSDDPDTLARVDTWLDYAASLTRLEPAQAHRAAVLTVERALRGGGSTYLVGHSLTLADLAVFGVLGFGTTTTTSSASSLPLVPPEATQTARWMRTLAVHPACQEATQLAAGMAVEVTDFVGTCPAMEPLVSGMNALQGAVPGRVVTRFPPEPSGYLHIGHAKAVLLNDYYARRYQGRLILRFDDTNPSKEKQEYQESIVVDLKKLGVTPDLVTYASDYFVVCQGYAVQLMTAGLAYMDDTPQEVMKEERANRQDSKHRRQPVEEALAKFKLMCSGTPEGAVWCLRAKIDMTSNNGTLRDPVLYRQNTTPHHRTGSTYKAYPTYDFSCPIVDSIEGVTHALRTTEYNDRDVQFQWIAKALGIRRPRNHAFSRVNFEYTVLSKRKLTWFVEQGLVTGWDDARFPTVRGVVRRGIDIAALRAFMYAQGASRNVVNMVWHAFWANNKKEIDVRAKRFMAIDAEQHAVLQITNAPAASDFAFKETSLHPKDPAMGTRAIRIADRVFLEKNDVDELVVGEEIVLMRWGVVKITAVDQDKMAFSGEYIPDGDFRKAKRKLSWLADTSDATPVVLYEFGDLVTKAKLEEDDKFEDHVNPNTMATTKVIGDAGLKTLQEHDIIQLERRGYYRVDRPYLCGSAYPLQLFMIPDGKQKSMSGLEGRLAHK